MNGFCTSCKPEIVLPVLQIKTKQFQVRNLYKTRKSTKNQLSNFGLFEETMNLSRILLGVKCKRIEKKTWFDS